MFGEKLDQNHRVGQVRQGVALILQLLKPLDLPIAQIGPVAGDQRDGQVLRQAVFLEAPPGAVGVVGQ
ncbi:hypothetical protein BV379_00145 [Rhodovulum sulfidophilum]|nr:hypothetical protein BV379_00145 [Rhodovulum sulfidophilum]